jgi:hypothetical protein
MSEENIIIKALKIERRGPNTYAANIGQDQRFGECESGSIFQLNLRCINKDGLWQSSMVASQHPY